MLDEIDGLSDLEVRRLAREMLRVKRVSNLEALVTLRDSPLPYLTAFGRKIVALREGSLSSENATLLTELAQLGS